MLIGSYTSVLGAKHRTVIPKKILKELGKDIYLAKWYEGCLVLISRDNLDVLLNKLTKKEDLITEPVRDTDRFILGSAFKIEVDEQGRTVIPKDLVDYALLEERLIFLALLDRVEVWDEKRWREREKYISVNASKFLERISSERRKIS